MSPFHKGRREQKDKQLRRSIDLKHYVFHVYKRAGLRDRFEKQIFIHVHKEASWNFVCNKAIRDFGAGIISPPTKTGIYFQKYMDLIASQSVQAIDKDRDKLELPF